MSAFRHRTRWLALVVFAALLAIGAYAVNPFGVRSFDPRQRISGHGLYRVAGNSMAPTIRAGQLLLVRAGYYTAHVPRRGEIAVMQAPAMAGQAWAARVVALPGETIAIRGGRVEIDGRVLTEPYVVPALRQHDHSRTMPAFTVPAGHYFLMGDNRDDSNDSRLLGPIRRDDLTGRVRAAFGDGGR